MLNSTAKLVAEICQAGAKIEVVGDNLRVSAPSGVLTEEAKLQLIGQKPLVLELAARALDILDERGICLLDYSGIAVVAMWRDADGPEVRAALGFVDLGTAEVRYLDDPDVWVPEHYRRLVPQYVRDLWRQRRLAITPDLKVCAELKARRINAFFDTFGTSPQPSRITAATVLHGMLARKARGGQQ